MPNSNGNTLRAWRQRALVVVAGLISAACFEGEIESKDRGLLVTADDLGSWGATVDPEAASLVERRVHYLDGSLDVEYEFEAAEQSQSPLYVSTAVGFDPSVSDARTTFKVQQASFEAVARVSGLAVQPNPTFFRYGDDSFFAMLEYDGAPVGNLFLARRDRKTYFFVVSGFYFDQPEAFAQLIEPKLAYLERYTP